MAFFEDDRVLDMTDEEIKRNVLGATDQKAQVKIVAELNATTEEVIRERLKAQGVDLRSLRGAVKKRVAETKRSKPEVPADKQEVSIAQACAVLHSRVRELLKQKRTIEDELTEIDIQLNRLSDSIAGRGEEL